MIDGCMKLYLVEIFNREIQCTLKQLTLTVRQNEQAEIGLIYTDKSKDLMFSSIKYRNCDIPTVKHN